MVLCFHSLILIYPLNDYLPAEVQKAVRETAQLQSQPILRHPIRPVAQPCWDMRFSHTIAHREVGLQIDQR